MYSVSRFQQLLACSRLTQLESSIRSRFCSQRLRVIMVALAIPALASTVQAFTSVTLAWDPNPEPDLAGYRVYLGTTSGALSLARDVGLATSCTLSSLTAATTYYCALQAYNTGGLESALSGEMAFTTPSATALFNTWASGGGLSGSGADPAAMPFSDGLPNLLKYAFNLNANGPDLRVLASGTGTAGLSIFSLDRSGPQPCLTVEFIRHKGSGLVYEPKSSTNLRTFSPMTAAPTVTDIDGEWERVRIKQPCDFPPAARIFGRVEVTLP